MEIQVSRPIEDIVDEHRGQGGVVLAISVTGFEVRKNRERIPRHGILLLCEKDTSEIGKKAAQMEWESLCFEFVP